MSLSEFHANYAEELHAALTSVDVKNLNLAASYLVSAISDERNIFVCGNGGSAAIADHWAVDFMKWIRTNSPLRPRITSLTSNVPVISAIANDISYEDVFAYQLESLAYENDILITVSSSGNSPNIKKAINTAKEMSMITIALCGFDGGASLEALVPLYVPFYNYGIVEDSHQAIMHILTQYITQAGVHSGSW